VYEVSGLLHPFDIYAVTSEGGFTMDSQTILQQALDGANSTVFSVWFLIGAALVFFMQAGFAMVETGFTRAKNAGNIIMKNLMDF